MASAVATQIADHRLPTNVLPIHYDLTIVTDLRKCTFDGIVKISLDVKEETDTIVLNTRDLKLTQVTVFLNDPDIEMRPVGMSFDKTAERVTFSLPESLPRDFKAQLDIIFEAPLTDVMRGYYRSRGGMDDKEIYSITQFEPISARRAFPCWDEPLLKATFTIQLVSRADTVNLSNMPIQSEVIYEPGSDVVPERTLSKWLASKLSSLTSGNEASTDKWKVTQFETTPRVSTYLIAYANGHFKYLEDSYTSPLSGKVRPLRIYATEEIIDKAAYALEVTKKVLPLYEKVFDIEYPLPKLDTLVAHDLDAGAMENWGLITGRKTSYLLDPNSGNLQVKKRIAADQCHEIAHMWFGNITTMAWWDNLYLNEGFATLMGEVVIPSKLFPEWKLPSAFIAEHVTAAMAIDSKLSSHPIEVDCPDANMVGQIFDRLSYSKAASVLRMLSDYVGEERFLKGVSIYLKKHLFANSVTTDLWEGISEATGLDIPKVMDDWIKKKGFPVLTVKEAAGGILVRQDRFLETGPAGQQENETIWTVPLSLLTVSEEGRVKVDKAAILDEREKMIALDITRTWKLNAGTVSFCRILYTPERLVKIGKEAGKAASTFSIEDRMGLVDDAFALAKAGYSTVGSALSLVENLRNEQEYMVWQIIAAGLVQLRSVWWEHEDIVENIQQMCRELFGSMVERVGFQYSDNDSADTRELRTLAITHAADAEHPAVVKELKERFAHYLKTGDDSNIPSELERAIFTTAVYHGGRAEWEAVKRIAAKPKDPSTGTAANLSLGNSQDPELIRETFEYVMKETRNQDVDRFVQGMAANPKARRYLVTAFKENYDAMYKRLEGNFAWQFLVPMPFTNLSSEKDYQDTKEFFTNVNTSKYEMAVQQTVEEIQIRAAWVKRSTSDIRQWFETSTRTVG